MEVPYNRVARLDVGKPTQTACGRTPGPRGRRSETRTFKTMVGSLRVMRDWLVSCGVTIAVDGVDVDVLDGAVPLEEVMEVWLLNAAQGQHRHGKVNETTSPAYCRIPHEH